MPGLILCKASTALCCIVPMCAPSLCLSVCVSLSLTDPRLQERTEPAFWARQEAMCWAFACNLCWALSENISSCLFLGENKNNNSNQSIPRPPNQCLLTVRVLWASFKKAVRDRREATSCPVWACLCVAAGLRGCRLAVLEWTEIQGPPGCPGPSYWSIVGRPAPGPELPPTCALQPPIEQQSRQQEVQPERWGASTGGPVTQVAVAAVSGEAVGDTHVADGLRVAAHGGFHAAFVYDAAQAGCRADPRVALFVVPTMHEDARALGRVGQLTEKTLLGGVGTGRAQHDKQEWQPPGHHGGHFGVPARLGPSRGSWLGLGCRRLRWEMWGAPDPASQGQRPRVPGAPLYPHPHEPAPETPLTPVSGPRCGGGVLTAPGDRDQ